MIRAIENEIVNIYKKLYDGGLSPSQIESMRENVYTIHHLIRASEDSRVVKTCSCGRCFTTTEWLELPLVGYQTYTMKGGEMRNCVCGSTLFLAPRKQSFSKTQSLILQHSILDSITGENTKPPFTLKECINISNAYGKMQSDFYLDKWSDRQVMEAAVYGRTPEWKVGKDGLLVPSY